MICKQCSFLNLHFSLSPDRVLSPVFESLKDMKKEIQQMVARIAVKAFCEAWLDHIHSTGIRFRFVIARTLDT